MTTLRSKLMLILATATLFVVAGSRRDASLLAVVPATTADATAKSVSLDGPFPPPVCPPICPPRVGVR